MGNLRTLLNKTEIFFPRHLNFTEVEGLFEHFFDNSMEITYWVNLSGWMNPGNPTPKGKYASEVTGKIRDRSPESKGVTMGSFECSTEPLEGFKGEIGPLPFYTNRFYGIKFGTIPGYDIEHHDDEEVNLWDKVRDLTEGYFSKEEK